MNRKFIYPSLFLLGLGLPVLTNSQKWDCSITTSDINRNKLNLNLNGGVTSHFGDLSIYDLDPVSKFRTESGVGFGVIGTWYITPLFGISGQLLEANIKAALNNVSFRTRIMEYNIHGRINFMSLFKNLDDPKFGFEGYAGIGQFFFTVIKYSENADQTVKTEYPAQVPEFVYFFGGGISYRITHNLSVTTDLAIRQCQTDRLDDMIRNNDFDYYSYLSVGLTVDVGHWINPKQKSRYKLK